MQHNLFTYWFDCLLNMFLDVTSDVSETAPRFGPCHEYAYDRHPLAIRCSFGGKMPFLDTVLHENALVQVIRQQVAVLCVSAKHSAAGRHDSKDHQTGFIIPPRVSSPHSLGRLLQVTVMSADTVLVVTLAAAPAVETHQAESKAIVSTQYFGRESALGCMCEDDALFSRALHMRSQPEYT